MPRHDTNVSNSSKTKVDACFILFALWLFAGLMDAKLLAQPPTSAPPKPTVPNGQSDLLRFELAAPAMGSHSDFVFYAPTEQQAKTVIDAGIAEIDD